jgi:hypothetical protein
MSSLTSSSTKNEAKTEVNYKSTLKRLKIHLILVDP